MKSIQNNVNRARIGSFVLGLAALATAAIAQPGAVEFASGLPHTSLGNAVIGPAEGRRLPVHNIGSSGQDGVEIHLNSVYGGGVTIDTGDFGATPGSEIKIKHKGWDGLIYGTHRSISGGGGGGGSGGFDEFDFSPLGATSIEVVDFDPTGHPISTTTIPGPFGGVPWVGQVIQCPPPCSWQPVVFWGYVNGKLHYAIGHRCMCPGTGGDGGTGTQWDRLVTPNLPIGVEPPLTGSLLLTASGMPEFAAVDSNLGTFGAYSLGLGQAHISEECLSSTGSCAPDERRLPIRNIGSSGQDGVEIKWPPATHASFQCDGPSPSSDGSTAQMRSSYHWLKPSWDNPRDFRVTQTCTPGGFTQMTFDTTDFGSAPIRITTSVGGTPTGGGSGEPLGYLINTNTLDWMLAHPFWHLHHLSLRVSNLITPTGEPMTIYLLQNGMFTAVPADTIEIEVLTTDLPDTCTGMSLTASNVGGNEFSVGSVVTTPAPNYCPSDVDDGSFSGTPDNGVTIDDLLYYLYIFEAGDLAADKDDGSFTGTLDNGVTIDDLLYYLFRFEAGC